MYPMVDEASRAVVVQDPKPQCLFKNGMLLWYLVLANQKNFSYPVCTMCDASKFWHPKIFVQKNKTKQQ